MYLQYGEFFSQHINVYKLYALGKKWRSNCIQGQQKLNSLLLFQKYNQESLLNQYFCWISQEKYLKLAGHDYWKKNNKYRILKIMKRQRMFNFVVKSFTVSNKLGSNIHTTVYNVENYYQIVILSSCELIVPSPVCVFFCIL